jgi:glycosyltransferase 2 family protein
MNGGRWRLLLQAVFSLALLGGLFWFMPAGSLAGLADADWAWVTVGVGSFWGGQALGGLRLYLLVRPLPALVGVPFSPFLLIRATVLGTFAGSFLPVTVGGDVIKLAWLARYTGKEAIPTLFTAMLVERLTSVGATLLFCLGVVSLLSVDISFLRTAVIQKGWLFLAVAMVLGACCLLWGWRSGATLARRLRACLVQAGEALRWWRSHPASIALCMAFSLAILVMSGLTVLALAHAVGHDLNALQAAAVTALVMLLNYLPISLSGLGVIETGMAGLLVVFTYPAKAAVQVAVLLRVVFLIGVLPGAFMFPHRSRTKVPR